MLTSLYKVSFLITLDIYKNYFKGRCVCRKWPSSLFSLKKLLRLYAKGFVTKKLPDLYCWWIEELCNQQPLQVVGVSHVLRYVHIGKTRTGIRASRERLWTKLAFAPLYQTIQHFVPFSKLIREIPLFWNSIFSKSS